MSLIDLPSSEINHNIHLPTIRQLCNLPLKRNATHKHDTIVIKLQINKCCTRLFELYWTDIFQREVKHCSGSFESRKIKKIHI